MVHSGNETLADALLELLAKRGVELFLANPGTDFVSLIDGFAKREERGLPYPRPLTAAHETTVMTLAHGYYLATGKPAAVMVHVGIGTANALAPLMAASRADIPVVFMAGRTPVTQSGHPASRSAYIHWGQDAYDQTAPIREWVKWDYELKRSEDLASVIDRAYLFGAPSPCHLFSRTNDLPILTVIYNNSGYHAVRRATRMVHPRGAAVQSGKIPLADLGDISDLHRIVEAFGGHGEKVERPEDLIPALDRAVNEVVNKGRQSVVNVIAAQC